jgi:hypothetical protein
MPLSAWIGFALGVSVEAVLLALCGATLGLFFGGVVAAALLVPPMCLSEDRWLDRLIVAAAVNDGIAAVWLVPAIASPQVTFIQWLLCYLVLLSWCAALAGIAGLCARLIRHLAPAAATVTLLALAWLSWPVWLAPHLAAVSGGRAVGWLVPAHPLFAVNRVLLHLGVWTERPIAYTHLMRLGQDVPYELPSGIVPAMVVHLSIGAVALLLALRSSSAGSR